MRQTDTGRVTGILVHNPHAAVCVPSQRTSFRDGFAGIAGWGGALEKPNAQFVDLGPVIYVEIEIVGPPAPAIEHD
jgi:hypothetical protein